MIVRIVIQLYWLIYPKHKKRKRLYAESCSHHVYRIVTEDGYKAAYKAFKNRFTNCRPGFSIIKIDNLTYILTAGGELIPEGELADGILS